MSSLSCQASVKRGTEVLSPRALAARLLAVLSLSVCACAHSARSNSEAQALDLLGSHAAQTPGGDEARDRANLARLEELWRSRTQAIGADADYPIGPGDVIEVSVPAVPELGDRTARVSGTGEIALPMVGRIQTSGLTEEKLREAIITRLEKYMYHPQVDVFVKEYRSRQVAVVGAVRAPGLLTLAGPSETILEVITRAGGMAGSAADQIILIPAEQGGSDAAQRVSSAASFADADGAQSAGEGRQPADADHALSVIPASSQPIVIALHSTSLSGAGQYLNMPVRPGDVIVVPGGGEVMVVGWVQNPGHFSVGSGLTVLGAIGAAGGPMYAANLHKVTLIRTDKDGNKSIIPIDLDQISSGEQPDPAVQGNDVIEVPYSGVKIGPYIAYQVMTRMGYGLGIPMP